MNTKNHSKDKSTAEPRERILSAALSEFSSKGFYGSRMQTIADRAGCNKAMLHYYFGNKDQLYQHILGQIFSELFRDIQKMVFYGDRKTWWIQLINAYLDFFIQHRECIPLILRELADDGPKLRTVLKELKVSPPGASDPLTIAEAVRKRIQSLSLGDLDPGHTVMSLVGLAMSSFFGKPLVEVFRGQEIQDFQRFLDERRVNIVALLEGRLPGLVVERNAIQ